MTAVHVDHDLTACGTIRDADGCETPTAADLCIGTAKGIKGNVYAADGSLIGHVFKQARRLRNTGGKFGEAWTANVHAPDGTRVSGSLGTRFTDRWHAARAVRAFWAAYPAERIATMVDDRQIRRYWPNLSEADIRMRAWHSAIGTAVARFKYDEYETCGLTARYRGADPRSYMTQAA